MKTREYFKRVETRMDKLRHVGELSSLQKKCFLEYFELFIFSDEKISIT